MGLLRMSTRILILACRTCRRKWLTLRSFGEKVEAGEVLEGMEGQEPRPWDHFGQHGRFGVRGTPHRKPMALEYRACAQKQACCINIRIHPDDGKLGHELQFRAYLPHTPGTRITAVNKLPQIKFRQVIK